MPKYSIITCISKPTIYSDCVLSSIQQYRGKHDIEIIPIYNTNGLYSASTALNIGIDTAKSDILIFCHQDVRLLFDWFCVLDKLIDNDWAILGSAGIALQYGINDIGYWGGAISTDTVAVGSVWHSDDIESQPYWDGIKELTRVHCVDECLFAIRKSTGLRFDTIFNGFHFYGIDICLQARAAAYNVCSAHLPIIHYGKYSSSFTGDKRYWAQLRLLHSKWQCQFPEMLATHLHWFNEKIISYIPYELESNDGRSITVKAMGIGKVMLADDRNRGIISQ